MTAKESNSRSDRMTFKRYVEAAEVTQQVNGDLWPQNAEGVRVLPVAIHLQAQARQQSKLDHQINVARGRVGVLEHKIAKLLRNRDKTQAYVIAAKLRLRAAALEGLSVAEFLERDHLAAKAHWSTQATHSREWSQQCFLIVRPRFRTKGATEAWLNRRIPALSMQTPLEYARDHGQKALAEFVANINFSEQLG